MSSAMQTPGRSAMEAYAVKAEKNLVLSIFSELSQPYVANVLKKWLNDNVKYNFLFQRQSKAAS